jgi:hypothetical protein
LADELADKLYSSAQRKKHGGHRDENTYDSFNAPQNPGTDGQGSYFGDTLRSIVNDRFRAMILSRNPELWQSLPAGKQNELENSPEFTAIEEELESLSLESTDNSIATASQSYVSPAVNGLPASRDGKTTAEAI